MSMTLANTNALLHSYVLKRQGHIITRFSGNMWRYDKSSAYATYSVFVPSDIPHLVLVVEKRSTLLVGGNGGLPASPRAAGNSGAAKEEGGHADESKDPLESNDFMVELANTEGSGENTEGKADCVILED